MITDCAHYQDGHRTHEGVMPLEAAAALAAHGGFVWLGLLEPGEEELAQVREIFGLHPLAVEDVLNPLSAAEDRRLRRRCAARHRAHRPL